MHVAVYNAVTAVCEEELCVKPARLISRLLRTKNWPPKSHHFIVGEGYLLYPQVSFDLLEPPIVGNEARPESLGVAVASPFISVPVTYSMTCTVLDSTSSDTTSRQDHLQPIMLGRTGLLQ